MMDGSSCLKGTVQQGSRMWRKVDVSEIMLEGCGYQNCINTINTDLAMMFFIFVSPWPGDGGSLRSCVESCSLESISGESVPDPRCCRSCCFSACSSFSFRCSTSFCSRSISCSYCNKRRFFLLYLPQYTPPPH